MPDTHAGYSLPIGAAVASDGVIVPAWVGYDIGCGMCAMPLSETKEDVTANAKAIFDQIYRDIPVGFNINKPSSVVHNPERATRLNPQDLSPEGRKIAEDKNWRNAVGSLGGGNHFIEIGADENDQVWVVIHSGSRGVGHGIATHYMKVASNSPKPLEGHHGLRIDSDAGQAYINEMIRRVALAVARHTDSSKVLWQFSPLNLINRNHNHATLREIDGRQLWIHRKGATHAEEGMDGVIPGNMRDGSFIVEGRGNPDSLYSSSHGAGRVLSRTKAKKQIAIEDFADAMQGITARIEESTKDESPFAYKNIFEVMRQQEDLVTVKHHVRPIINIKG
jgi:tRNA-splicing ligase RtcB